MSYSSSLFSNLQMPVRRKCFISYYREDTIAVRKFLTDFADVFIAKEIGVRDTDNFINSTDSDYVMSRIRANHLGDSTVTICLIGQCSHSRRYVDWEIKSSLRSGLVYTPNGLLGILLPHMKNSGHLPERFKLNWNQDESKCYGMFRAYPKTKQELRGWIEEAVQRRTSKAHLINNPQKMMGYNRKCLVHGITH